MDGLYDAVVVGGGHNGLVAAAYLAGAGRSVLVLEKLPQVGGAAVGEQAFTGVPARLSRYSYLVSLLPDRITTDLGLRLELRSRAVSSYTPVSGGAGLLVEREPGPATASSFRALSGSESDWEAWRGWYGEVAALASALAPTLLEPLPSRERVEHLAGGLWGPLFERPIGEALRERFAHDVVRGVVATDALIGTHASLDADLAANRCFLYHVVGNGTGEWRVPVGGMGAVTAELLRVARAAGAEVVTGAEVTSVRADGRVAEVEFADRDGVPRTVGARFALVNAAPAELARLRGLPVGPVADGCQLKVNMLLERLPGLRSGVDPRVAFAGTLHLDESYRALEGAYRDSAAGLVPEVLPAEMYCHTLTDPSILDPGLVGRGWHTLTLFGLHTPARLFEGDNAGLRAHLVGRYLTALNEHLVEPIEGCLAVDADGRPCLEARTPLDLEAEIGLPRGHIFHGDLDWPFAERPEQVGTWGVETDVDNLLVCGAGARRGGGVSGIGGHNAAMAVLARLSGTA
ncbi:phytoene desaturase family protein [Actinosynnema mirum]|uniref:FAD dependent oxidoreductase n=1 Tax=Actinosynnema mirum (strain ATCC 29888 / DSM 43827 / JCM 3225 / NBRC 14064 / NCIMB 13271 / NRRL B-12336 / IMRU 3971 / 101) TaxID=446462 RepID=C6WQ59_ACTMD|nr:NAD(P)/FAD-dependent oxidoreductase [Actinosynnema mirum]ACU35115.1 FAD dependent oxidoreductase [Actinosynnema mirum DSM 43827]